MSKPKPVNWELIEANNTEIYDLIQGVIHQYHSGQNRLDDLNYVLMWRHNVKPDQDGYIILAEVSKSSDKMRELRPHDVIIGINKAAWSWLSEVQKRLVVDYQLERIVQCLDKEDQPKEDDRSRLVYRLKRMEVIDDQTMMRRHNMNIYQVQEYILHKLKGEFTSNSYVGKILQGNDDDPN